ncbi:putative Ig domain-containing protein [Flexivirga alba]|uniref:Ig domain-containing protein n=1 Tax=Flexivirga alba TaxID=702742 RepID=A0ABW2AE12_9MICO
MATPASASSSGSVATGATAATTAAATTAAATSVPGLVSLSPARVLDTRLGVGAPKGRPAAGATTTLSVAGHGGVPATGVAAVVVNVTVADTAGPGYVTVWPAGASRPTASNLNYVKGQVVANQVITKVGTGGAIALYDGVSATDLIVDVTGYYPTGSAYNPLVPTRVLDTRPGSEPGAKSTTKLVLTGKGGVPATGVAAVVLNVTAVNPAGPGFVTVYPAGVTRPNASNLNYTKGAVVPAMVIATLGTGGAIDLYTLDSTDLIVDVAGWIPTGTDYHPVTPARVLDTRSGLGAAKKKVPGNSAISVQVAGQGGIPATGVAAVEANVTVVGPSQAGFITAYPSGTTRPTASMLNYDTGQIVANSVTIKLGADGKLALYTGWGTTDLLLDITGYWTSGPPLLITAPTAASLPSAVAGSPYQVQFTGTGGTTPYRWSATGLPAGLTLDSSTGVLIGTPTATGSTPSTITLTDIAGRTTQEKITIAVPTAVPTQCQGQACSVTDNGVNTIHLTSNQLVNVARDSAGAIAAVTTNGVTVTNSNVLVLPVTADTPSGAIDIVNSTTTDTSGNTVSQVTPGTPAQAYNSGTIQTSGTTSTTAGKTPAGVKTWIDGKPVANGTPVKTAATVKCDGNVTAQAEVTLTTTLTPELTAIWKHPLIQIGNVYVGTGGLDTAYVALDGSIKIGFDSSITATGHCSLTLPEITRAVPAGDLGAVVFDAKPSIDLDATAGITVDTSATLECSTSYYWHAGHGLPTNYCTASTTPLQLSAAKASATLTGHLPVTVSLDDAAGITGTLTPTLTATENAGGNPWATLDGKVDASIGACLACFWNDGPKTTLASGTIWSKRLITLSSAPTPPTSPLSIATVNLPTGTVGTAYAATLAATGGTPPYTWTATGLPAGLTLNATTGTITGVPTTVGARSVSLTVTDKTDHSSSTNTDLAISSATPSKPLVWSAPAPLTSTEVATSFRCRARPEGSALPLTRAGTRSPTTAPLGPHQQASIPTTGLH